MPEAGHSRQGGSCQKPWPWAVLAYTVFSFFGGTCCQPTAYKNPDSQSLAKSKDLIPRARFLWGSSGWSLGPSGRAWLPGCHLPPPTFHLTLFCFLLGPCRHLNRNLGEGEEVRG